MKSLWTGFKYKINKVVENNKWRNKSDDEETSRGQDRTAGSDNRGISLIHDATN